MIRLSFVSVCCEVPVWISGSGPETRHIFRSRGSSWWTSHERSLSCAATWREITECAILGRSQWLPCTSLLQRGCKTPGSPASMITRHSIVLLGNASACFFIATGRVPYKSDYSKYSSLNFYFVRLGVKFRRSGMNWTRNKLLQADVDKMEPTFSGQHSVVRSLCHWGIFHFEVWTTPHRHL